jgi:chemotaxis protein CheD
MSIAIAILPPDPALGSTARLEQLKALPRKPGQASFFFYDAHFKCEAVKVLPGEYFVFDRGHPDHDHAGLVHRRLPVGPRQAHRRHEPLHAARRQRHCTDGGRYGSYAMELLINELIKRGATR